MEEVKVKILKELDTKRKVILNTNDPKEIAQTAEEALQLFKVNYIPRQIVIGGVIYYNTKGYEIYSKILTDEIEKLRTGWFNNLSDAKFQIVASIISIMIEYSNEGILQIQKIVSEEKK